MTWHVYPQDEGTGTPKGDWADAANDAQLAYDPYSVGYIVSGFTLSYDGGNQVVTAQAGVAKVEVGSLESKDHGEGSETRTHAAIVVESTGTATAGVEAGSVNTVYIRVDPTVNNGGEVVSSASEPEGYTLEIATLDPSDGSITPLNRENPLKSELDDHAGNTSNPHNVTAEESGALSSDADASDVNALPADADASDLSGANGTDGQLLGSDGTNASWVDAPSGGGGGGGLSKSDIEATTMYAGVYITVGSDDQAAGDSSYEVNQRSINSYYGVTVMGDSSPRELINGTIQSENPVYGYHITWADGTTTTITPSANGASEYSGYGIDTSSDRELSLPRLSDPITRLELLYSNSVNGDKVGYEIWLK